MGINISSTAYVCVREITVQSTMRALEIVRCWIGVTHVTQRVRSAFLLLRASFSEIGTGSRRARRTRTAS
jgi:hypothetical protein